MQINPFLVVTQVRNAVFLALSLPVIYSRTPIIRTPIIRNAYYPNTTLTKEIRTSQEALERQLRLREKMRPKTNKQLTRARRAVFTVFTVYNIGKATTE